MVRLDWNREELILAGDLADDLGWSPVNARSPGIPDLSQLLRSANFHPMHLRDANFRTAGSVNRKINNLRAWIPKVGQKGLFANESVDR